MQALQQLKQRGGWSVALFGIIFLAGCSFGGAQATPVPVDLPVYQPGVAATETGAAPASASPEQVVDTTPAPTATAEITATALLTATELETAPATTPVSATPAATPARTVSAAADAPAPTPSAVPPTPAASAAPLAVYAAEIVVDEELVVVSEVSGQVLALLVEIGDYVSAGDPIVRVDSTILEAQRAQALAGVRAAQAQLDQLLVGANAEDLEAARAAVAAASAAYNRAANGLTEEEQRQALAQLQQAQAAVEVATAGYNLVRGVPELGALPQSLQLQQATLALEAAQAQYDRIIQGATDDQIAGAYAQLAAARATLERLQTGAKPAQIRAAEASVRLAEQSLYLAQLQLDKATVTAPTSGVVAQLQTAVGAVAAPGVPLLTLLADTVDVLIDVEESRLAELRVGQPATIRVQAYPNQTFAGEVALIAPELNAATRTVQVTIRPEDPDGLLVPGMTAFVDLFE